MGSRNWKLFAALGLATIAILGVVATAGADHANVILTAELNGRNEVVANATNRGMVGDPNGKGEAIVFGIDHTTLCYVLFVDKIATAMLAHIHDGGSGVNGPIVVHFDAPADGSSADCVSELPEALVADIQANPQDYYVNVHNADFPGGAIRGQLAPQS